MISQPNLFIFDIYFMAIFYGIWINLYLFWWFLVNFQRYLILMINNIFIEFVN